MSIPALAARVVAFCEQNDISMQQDPRGAAFTGGILLDLGEGERIAFLMPTDDPAPAYDNLHTYLDEVYPAGFECGPVWRDLQYDLLMVRVEVAEASLPLTGSAA